MRRRLLRQNQKADPTASKLTYPQYYMAGAYAGVGNSVLSGPIEHIRIKLQTQPSGEKRLYSGPADCIRKIYQVDGLRGIYRAQVPTILREGQGFGLWFLTYEYLVQRSIIATGVKRDDLPAWKLCGFGAVAGLILWIGSYPLDVIKSRMQSDPGLRNKVPDTMAEFKGNLATIGSVPRYDGMVDCARKIYSQSGFGGFWRGIGPTLVRAIPCSSGTFAAYVPMHENGTDSQGRTHVTIVGLNKLEMHAHKVNTQTIELHRILYNRGFILCRRCEFYESILSAAASPHLAEMHFEPTSRCDCAFLQLPP